MSPAPSTAARVDAIARALLYEGYVLYPYRASSAKNRRRFDFGVLRPSAACAPASADASSMQTECLLELAGDDAPCALRVTVRFLHLLERARDGDDEPAARWLEAVEREVALELPDITHGAARARTCGFAFPADARVAGGAARRQRAIEGELCVTVAPDAGAPGVARVRAVVRNLTAFEPPAPDTDRHRAEDEVLLASLVATHTVLAVERDTAGSLPGFVSQIDPPARLREAAARCTSTGTWPVLAGPPGDRGAVLSAPIILYDHPELAPESPGDLFDATEIDEILTLRILTLTDDEKRAMRAVDARARALLERTEALSPRARARLHGALRLEGGARVPTAPDDAVPVFHAGDRVRLAPRPGRGADIFDLALAGRSATVAAVEQDLEGGVYLAVTVDDDPGRDLGATGYPGHRFFFRPEEVERL